jgi:hypothetical protein
MKDEKKQIMQRHCHDFCAELEYEYVEEGAESGSQLATNIRDIKNEFLANKAQKKQATKDPNETLKTKLENLKNEQSLPNKGKVDPRLTVKASQQLPTDRLKIDQAQPVKAESGQGQKDKPEDGEATVDKAGSGQALEAKMEAGQGKNDKPENDSAQKDKTAAEEASKRRGARPQHPRKVARVPFGAKLAVTRVRRPIKLQSVKTTTNKAGMTSNF